MFAHRGASYYAPENTLAAFMKAKDLGLRWLEFDVMLTADEKVVVIHDETLDRTTNGSGYVSDYSYKELKNLDAGSWFHPKFSDEKILLLSDLIIWMCKQQMDANIEIKALAGKEDLTAKKVMDVIRCHWIPEKGPPLLSSFSLDILYALRRLDSNCCLGLLMDEWMPNWKAICDELHCVSVHPNEKCLNQEKVSEIKLTHRSVFCYTVNDVDRAQELFSWGVDAIYSDCPKSILTL